MRARNRTPADASPAVRETRPDGTCHGDGGALAYLQYATGGGNRLRGRARE